MPSGKTISERDRCHILDLLAQDRLTFREIGIATGYCERTVALVVRQYAAFHRRLEKQAQRLEELRDRE